MVENPSTRGFILLSGQLPSPCKRLEKAHCVEFAAYDNGIAIRHSKVPNGPALLYTRPEIAAMIERFKAGESDHLAEG
ncbi:uncharacterized protein DUF397 [Streptomyces sp. TLI_185]|nr:uncharacterized protein DUF397 [Streptomyces sp. TLI_185]